ncbi:NAD(P)H-dependent oxidoreductase [Cyanobium sp. HWJ4-Hawea]|uniref:NADPH-dependent FMN reductase n=1 Tax=unclassified Cyanobium TaxID=2627006 RepID=UPI0020CB7257|nr:MULTISPECIES: NAD(P)H-dependent oxidoreductase [unclassified Cyanobium]MCP9774879.1 NAD(P)H-dependent oxidoreductase [Cyanobium sp. WAJ14-Wanaka]MCP9808970.1 NAD(P)H-dependent oxidoreductase [Cyanobium sp. HWJ4-Hawea]
MEDPFDLLVLAASCGENLKLANRFSEAAAALGKRTMVIDLTLSSLPLFTPRNQQQLVLPDVIELQRQLESASHWIICAPEYNGSIPPSLTSAIAWLSTQGNDFRALFNRHPVAIASHSGGGGYECLSALRIQLAHLGANVLGRQLVCTNDRPAKQQSIDDVIGALFQLRA